MPNRTLTLSSQNESTFIRGSDLESYFVGNEQGAEDIHTLIGELRKLLKKNGVIDINILRRGMHEGMAYRSVSFNPDAITSADPGNTDIERKMYREFTIVLKLVQGESLTSEEKRHKINCSEMRSMLIKLKELSDASGKKTGEIMTHVSDCIRRIMRDFANQSRVVREDALYIEFRDRNIDELSLSVSRYTQWRGGQIHYFLVRLSRVHSPLYDRIFTLEKFLDKLKSLNVSLDVHHNRIALEIIEMIPDDDDSEEIYIRLKDKIEALTVK